MDKLLLSLLSILAVASVCVARQVAMKIVEEPSSFGYPYQQESQEETLKMRITPSNFSGPNHLRVLQGKCFTKIDESYKYELCPYSNVTQHEQSLRWNPYSGILGVWQEWSIVNNTFQAMLMGEGDACGDHYRSVKVELHCGEKHEIESVTEPEKCFYLLVFKTPLVCHRHSLLVYPTLNETLRHQWDLIEGEYFHGELTTQGYNKKLHHLFERAGYVLPLSKKQAIAKQAIEKENMKEELHTGDFYDLGTCTDEYKKLKKEVENLRTLLAVYQSGNKTSEKDKHQQTMDYYDGRSMEDWDDHGGY